MVGLCGFGRCNDESDGLRPRRRGELSRFCRLGGDATGLLLFAFKRLLSRRLGEASGVRFRRRGGELSGLRLLRLGGEGTGLLLRRLGGDASGLLNVVSAHLLPRR